MAEASSPSGKFVWYEYMGNDLKAAADFYTGVVGWSAKDAGMSGFPYQVLSTGSTMVAGMMDVPEEAKAMGAKPSWLGYIWVEDVDKALPKLTAAGGNPPPPPPPGTPGLVGWRELHAGDGARAFAFYSGQFGWKKERDHDMGAMGVYHIFDAGDGQQGGVFTKTPETPAPFWLFYFNVDAIDSAVERVKAHGGKVVNGPMETPNGRWILQGLDPQSAMFALVAPKR